MGLSQEALVGVKTTQCYLSLHIEGPAEPCEGKSCLVLRKRERRADRMSSGTSEKQETQRLSCASSYVRIIYPLLDRKLKGGALLHRTCCNRLALCQDALL